MKTLRPTANLRLAFAVPFISAIAWATPIQFITPSGSATSDGSVNASVMFAASPGTLTITLTDLLGNPASVGQLLSSLQFSLSSSLGASGSMSSSAQERTVNGDKSFTERATVSTGWALQTSGGGLVMICMICPNNGTPPPVNPPAHLIIGAAANTGMYANANGSIAGNHPHNPFLDESATFTISNSSITSATAVSNVVFGFGTQFGSEVRAEESLAAVPENNTMLLIGTGLILLGRFRKHAAKLL